MPDYRFEGLSTRSFEQLVQALAAKIIGPNIVIFGDGPDGGREATFSGKINYSTKDATWDGEGILQAKFLQRPSGKPKQDADWLLAQLSEEMKKFKKRSALTRTKRDAPDYYILATNVVLSSVNRKGGKDRVYAAMKELQAKLGWKGFDIWDADKISRFLDGNRDIATTYAAWITAGDVLSEVISNLKATRPDFQNVMFTFLQKELLAAQYANLRQAGHSDQDRIPLSRVFVDLPVTRKQCFEPPIEPKPESKFDPEESVISLVANLIALGSARLSQSEATVGILDRPAGTRWLEYFTNSQLKALPKSEAELLDYLSHAPKVSEKSAKERLQSVVGT